MAAKFDQRKVKHQLLHISTSLLTVLLCVSYIHKAQDWHNIGRLWNSLVLPIVLFGEIGKLAISRYFEKDDRDTIIAQQRKKFGLPSLKDVAGALFLQTICTLLYSFTCIIFGAPVLQNYEQTFVLSLLLTLLTVSPTVFLLGMSGTLQVVFCENADFLTKSKDTAVELFKYNAVGAICGAWAGSIVAPLDWDRDWQAYPIPNVIGALLGCGVANIYICSKVLLSTGKAYVNKHRS